MNFKKQIFILAFGCFFLALLQSCNKENVNTQSNEKEDPSAVAVDTRTACFSMMQEISWANGDDCAQNSADLLEDALEDLSGNVNDGTIANVMFHQIGYFIHLVTCDPSYECYNCDDYLALANAFADCLESEGSTYAGWLDNIIITLENACSECVDPECCDDVSLTVTSVPHPVQEGCCLVNVELNDPNGCTDGTGIVYYPKDDASVSTTYPLQTTVCPDFGPQEYLLNDCYVSASASASDCEEVDCCEGVSLIATSTPHSSQEGCCDVLVELIDPNGCTDGTGTIYHPNAGATVPTTYPLRTTVCDDFGPQQYLLNDCDVSAEVSVEDCEEKSCCEQAQITVTQTPFGENCCRVRFDVSGCPDGFLFQFKGGPKIPIEGNFYQVDLCNTFIKVRVFHPECKVASGWIRKDC